MKPPILRLPTRDARDADHMALITVAGGLYCWWGRAALPDATRPWLMAIAAASILCGVLLWLRIPAIKWLGVLVFIAMCGFGVRRFALQGFDMRVALLILLPVVCAIWMAQIDYSHKFADGEAA